MFGGCSAAVQSLEIKITVIEKHPGANLMLKTMRSLGTDTITTLTL